MIATQSAPCLDWKPGSTEGDTRTGALRAFSPDRGRPPFAHLYQVYRPTIVHRYETDHHFRAWFASSNYSVQLELGRFDTQAEAIAACEEHAAAL
jgi:hypothetical protein